MPRYNGGMNAPALRALVPLVVAASSLAAACGSNSAPAPAQPTPTAGAVLAGVYTASAGSTSPYAELGFNDATHYFAWRSGCTGAGACAESGTYAASPNTLTLTDAATGAVTVLPYSVTRTVVGPADARGTVHVLGTGDAGSIQSMIASFLLSGQSFLQWGPSGISGYFSSSQCEAMPDGEFELRHYNFGAGGATAEWDRYGDATCDTGSQLMSIVITGGASFNELSPTVPRTVDITVTMNQKTITPTAAGLALLQQDCTGYTFQAGLPQVVTTGCGTLLQQTDDCAAEYDLMTLTLSGLVFGDRSSPLCSAATRPTQLGIYAVVPGSGYVPPVTSPPDAGIDAAIGDAGADAAADVTLLDISDAAFDGYFEASGDGPVVTTEAGLIAGSCSHDVCTVGDRLGQQCDQCTMLICTNDPYCCDTYWGPSCFTDVQAYCGHTCP